MMDLITFILIALVVLIQLANIRADIENRKQLEAELDRRLEFLKKLEEI